MGDILSPFGAPEGLGGPEGPDLVPTAANWSEWAGIIVTRHFDLVSGLFWPPGIPKGSPRGALNTPEWANMTYNHVLYMCEGGP
jgi:hypothetical protein